MNNDNEIFINIAKATAIILTLSSIVCMLISLNKFENAILGITILFSGIILGEFLYGMACIIENIDKGGKNKNGNY